MSFADRDGFIWLDGEWLPWREAKIHVLTHTLHYGLGVFEGVRAYEGPKGTAIFRLQDHTARLFRSAKIMNLKMTYTEAELNEVQLEVLRRNKLKSGYLRPLVFLGSEGMGLRADNLNSHVMIASWAWGAYLGKEALENGIKLRTSSLTRHHVNISLCKAKAVGNYSNSMFALQEAVQSGADEAMLLDPEGYVAEGSGENIFLVRNGILYTPEPTSCLEGITRETILQFAEEQGLKVKETRITRDSVYIADEVFLTGTAAEITPVREVDGRVIGTGKPGPITKQMQTLYFDAVQGKSKIHEKWLSYI